jgi:hypothetical protein
LETIRIFKPEFHPRKQDLQTHDPERFPFDSYMLFKEVKHLEQLRNETADAD